MKVRVTKVATRPVVVAEGMLALVLDGVTAESRLHFEDTVRRSGVLAVICTTPEGGPATWTSTKVFPGSVRHAAGAVWHVKTLNSNYSVEVLADDAEVKRLRKATGVIPTIKF